MFLNEEEFVEGVLGRNVLLFDSKYHPDTPSGYFNGGNYHDQDVRFEGQSPEDVRRNVEHPDKPED